VTTQSASAGAGGLVLVKIFRVPFWMPTPGGINGAKSMPNMHCSPGAASGL
jgi:hypothetical protein